MQMPSLLNIKLLKGFWVGLQVRGLITGMVATGQEMDREKQILQGQGNVREF